MFRIAILISGTGSNMASLLQYEAAHPDAPIMSGVINNRPAGGLATAKTFGVPHLSIERRRIFPPA